MTRSADTLQKELMRHTSIQTTMNVYGRAMTDGKRQAQNNVVQMVLKPADNTTKARRRGRRSGTAGYCGLGICA
jgi:integrase